MTVTRQIRFNNHEGERLAATVEMPTRPADKAVVLGHCFTCTRHTRILSDLSRVMAEIGYFALRFDFSGNGQSEGAFADSTYSKQIREIECAVEFVRNQGVSDIFLAGHSMGGAAALLAASRINGIMGVVAVSVDATLLHPDRVLSETQKLLLLEQGAAPFSSRGRKLILTKNFFLDADRYDLPGTVSKIPCPILLVYGGRDTIVEPDSGRRLYDARPSQTKILMVDEADHMFSQDRDRRMTVDHVVKWMQTL